MSVGTGADAATVSDVIGADDTLATAYDHIRRAGNGLVAVVGAERRFLGALSDADLRRLVAAGRTLDTPVASVLPRHHRSVSSSTSDDDVRALLVASRSRAVPVVDDGRLVGVRVVDEFPEVRGEAPIAVVMVGGRGERLKPLTDKVPKPLLRIGGKPIVERIILGLAKAGVHDVYLAVNYMAAEFEDQLGDGDALGVALHYLHEDEVLGTAGALSLLAFTPTTPVLVTNGDLVTTVDYASLFDFHWHHGGAITVAGVQYLTPIPYGVLRSVEHHLLGVDEKPQRRDLINAGMYVLQPEALRFIPPGLVGMPDLIDDVIAAGLPVHVFPLLERWFDIGSHEELERVLQLFATGEEE